jgi:hypothetical protein
MLAQAVQFNSADLSDLACYVQPTSKEVSAYKLKKGNVYHCPVNRMAFEIATVPCIEGNTVNFTGTYRNCALFFSLPLRELVEIGC